MWAVVSSLLISIGGLEQAAKDSPAEDRAAQAASPSPALNSENARRLDEMRQAAARYRISSESGPSAKLVLRTEPIFRWTNPVQGSIDGALFLWTEGGRPGAILGIYPTVESPLFSHEFQSLARGPLVARQGQEVIWSPDMAGVEFKPIPGAEPPAQTAARRLLQMKALARNFSSTFLRMVHTDEKNRIDLRLLPQPLFRYELAETAADRTGPLDGALFAFVQGTDPQTLLLLEARHNGSKYEWMYALARSASGAVDARYRGQVVWSVPKYDFAPDPRRPFLLLRNR